MTDSTHEFKILVERAVRPVRAPRTRKKAMRNELLAHLSDVFEDELAKLNDESRALANTHSRFGDAAALTDELQHTVTLRQRAGVFFEQLDWTRPMPLRALVARHALVGLASIFFVFLLILPMIFLDGRRQTLEFAVRAAIMQGVFVGLFGCVMGGLCPTLGDALFGDAQQRSWRRAAWCLLASVTFLPVFAFVFYFGLSGDLAASLSHFAYACWFAPVFPLLCTAISWEIHREHTYDREWAALDLSERDSQPAT
jgi:hypothetical protein